jgi:quercetin dioxygenase-like cupin family protein
MDTDTTLPQSLEDCAADAALYVLGALSPEMAGAFELRLRSGCSYCSMQAEHFTVIAENLSLAANPVEPRPALRQRLLDRLQIRKDATQPSKQMKVVRSGDAPWVKMPFPGIEVRPLIGEKTLMLRMQPGAVFPEHYHPGAEQCYVLEGSITDSDGITLNAGDFVVMPAGIQHAPIRSETGCTLFIAYVR